MVKAHALRIAARMMAIVGVAALLGGVSANEASAYAPNEIYACGQTCATNCTGISNCRTASSSPAKCVVFGAVSCTATDSTILLKDGTDLEFYGTGSTAATITCTETDPNRCQYPAITMDAAGSKVTNTGTLEAIISGRFDSGVYCANKTSSIVEKITVEDGYTGIHSCQTVRNTVVGPTEQVSYLGTNVGILSVGISNGDSITDNFVSGRLIPIYSTSTYSLDVLRNVIWGTGYNAIWLTAGTPAGNVKKNVVFSSSGGGAGVISSAAGPSFDGNYCAPDITGCATCISAGQCEPYTSPFQGN